MTHYVLMTLKPGADIDAVERRVRETFRALDEALPWLNGPAVYRNCVERDVNADIMVRVQIDAPEQLQTYLDHPLHVKMKQDLKDSLSGKVSFDCL